MRERVIEQYLRKRVEAAGGLCLKITSPGRRGVPDRLVLMDCGHTFWVELKSTDGKLHPLQKVTIAEFERLGHLVFVINSKAGVDELFPPQPRRTGVLR